MTEEDSKGQLFQSNSNLRQGSFTVASRATKRQISLPIPMGASSSSPFTRSLDDSNITKGYKTINLSGSPLAGKRSVSLNPVSGSNSDMSYETINTAEALQDLDEFLDLMGSEQTDKQNDSFPGDDPSLDKAESNNAVRGSGFPRYYLSTGSYTGRGGMTGTSPPAYSMPDLTTLDAPDEEEENNMEEEACVTATSPSYAPPPLPQHHQCQLNDASSSKKEEEGAGQGGYGRHSSDSYNQWDSKGGGIPMYDNHMIAHTKRRMSDGEKRPPSPLSIMSYSSAETRYDVCV